MAIEPAVVAVAREVAAVVSRATAVAFPTKAAGPRAVTFDCGLGEPIIGMVSMGKPSDGVSSALGEYGCRRVAFVFSNEAVLRAMMTGELRTGSRPLVPGPSHTIECCTQVNGMVDDISEEGSQVVAVTCHRSLR